MAYYRAEKSSAVLSTDQLILKLVFSACSLGLFSRAQVTSAWQISDCLADLSVVKKHLQSAGQSSTWVLFCTKD